MPITLEAFEAPNMLLQYRGIRAGERPDGKAPNKKPLRVRHEPKNKETHKYDPDEKVMKGAARRLGVPVDEWLSVREVPVMLLSDNVEGEDGVIYLERAWYTSHKRRCGSPAHIANAVCFVDIDDYVKSKKTTWLRKPREFECTDKCPMWVKPEERGGKKEECKWRVIVNVQLLDSPVYPSPTRYRTAGVNTIRTLITSLNHISSITGGVLMGIPLWLRQSFKDVIDGTGKWRRIPVVTFDFKGTVQELREYARLELLSRKQLVDAREDKWPDNLPPVTFIDKDLDTDKIEALPEDDADVEEIQKQQLIESSSKIALLAKDLNFTRARMQALEDKHQGDMDAMLAELKTMAGGSQFNPSPGEPGAEQAETESADNSDWDDGMFDM